MLAGIQGQDRRRHVPVVGGRNGHRVDVRVVENPPQVVHRFGSARLAGGLISPLFVRVAHVDEFGIDPLGEPADVGAPALAPTADDRVTDTIVGARRFGRDRGQNRGYRGNGGYSPGTLQEFPSIDFTFYH